VSERTVYINGNDLTIEDVLFIARNEALVALDPNPAVRQKILDSYELNQEIVNSGVPVYGVTTGVGDAVSRQISYERAARMQENLVKLNNCGVGNLLTKEQSRAITLIRANAMAKGYSAVSMELIDRLLEMLNRDIVPCIPELGSVGASGDLIPGSYVAAVVVGRGKALYKGEIVETSTAYEKEGLKPLRLQSKEGLALLNGTPVMSGIGVLALHEAKEVAKLADICTALTTEVTASVTGPFHPFIHETKPYKGQIQSASHVRQLLEGSKMSRSYDEVLDRVGKMEAGQGTRKLDVQIQNKYSIRCAPHFIGVLYDAIDWMTDWLEIEINSANDNPLYDLDERKVHSGGNFSGGHVGLAMDALKNAVASVIDLLDRQYAIILDDKFNNGLTQGLYANLPEDHPEHGLQHGFKSSQLLVSAITAEALQKAIPMTIFSRPTEVNNQDKVSMATIASRQAYDITKLAKNVIAMHLLGLCQGADLRGADMLGKSRAIYDQVREVSPFVDVDRALDGDIERVVELIESGKLTKILS
jgi:phenylalanine ammonia-lyase